jgi:hypothetical protein
MLREAVIVAHDRGGRSLAARLRQGGDRYGQEIVASGPELPPLALLRSIEATAEEPRREAPVLQELNVEQLPDGRGAAAALLGRAFDCLWSLAIAPVADPEAPGLLFDAACRLKRSGARLASVYRIPDDVVVSRQPGGAWSLAAHRARFVIEPVALPAGGPPLVVEHDAAQLRFVCDAASWTDLPATLRWQFRIRWT